MKAIQGVQKAEKENRKQVRRERIKRFYRERAGFEHDDDLFGYDEKECLRKLMPLGPQEAMASMFGFDEDNGSKDEAMDAFDLLSARVGMGWDDFGEDDEDDDDR
ncbi:hypothetical protein KC330_g1592 [Hortaea werneckii]|nr:hypothetical protein KC330_g1592 [Hortaea werneckii]